MKIKRFEADSMAEALRLIKKEFGEDAIILSAKSLKKGARFLGKKGSQQVVVTAAVDDVSNAQTLGNNKHVKKEYELGSGQEKKKKGGAFLSGDGIFKHFNPITKTGQKVLKPKIVQMMNETRQKDDLYQHLIDKGLNEEIASEWNEQMRGLLPEENVNDKDKLQALSQVIQVKGVTCSLPPQDKPEKGRCIVLMGPSGSGKTTAAAKMAAKYALIYPDSVAIVSLDNQRVAGTVELERFAKIIEAPFYTAFKPADLQKVFSQLQSYSMIIVDTPGISLNAAIQREKLRRLTDSIDHAENILVINAAMQDKSMARAIDFFQPLNIKNLYFTCLDWTFDHGIMINQADRYNLHIGYISDTPKIADGLQIATSDNLSGMLLDVQGVDALSDDQITVIRKNQTGKSNYYVANRNSDIFHFHDCKSVKRINTDNMIVFKNPAEAMGQQFKPCRMCCSELIQETVKPPVRGYAGNRYYR